MKAFLNGYQTRWIPRFMLAQKWVHVKFTEKHSAEEMNWAKILFNDDKKFKLYWPDGIHAYQHEIWEESDEFTKRQQDGGLGERFPQKERSN